MKKIVIFLLICLFPLSIVNASDDTYERKPENNYGSKKFDIDTENKKEHVLRTPYVDVSKKVYDFAEILTDEEELDLREEIMDFIHEYDTELVIVTINMSYYKDSENEDYAADFYDYNDFGLDFEKYDGIVLLHNVYPKNNYYNIYTFGNAQLYFGDERYDTALDEIYTDLKSGNYYKGYIKFIDRMSYFYSQGRDKELKNYAVDKKGFLYKKFNIPWVFSFIISAIVTSIIMGVLISKNKMVKKAYYASEYLDKDSVTYRKNIDIFVTTHTTKTYIPPSSSGGSSGGGGHSSSSGSSGGGHSSGSGRH